MKKRLSILLLATIGTAAALLLAGCAHASKRSVSSHSIERYAAAVPPDWRVIVPEGQLNLPADETNGYADFAFDGETNTDTGFFGPRPRIFLAYRETWTDVSLGVGTFLFTDPQASQVNSQVSNQSALAGGHTFGVGSVSSTITTNSVTAIGATGGAIGNVIGEAAKAIAGKP